MSIMSRTARVAAPSPVGQADGLVPAPRPFPFDPVMRRLRVAIRAAEDLADGACHLPGTSDDELATLYDVDQRESGWVAVHLGPEAERLVRAAEDARWHVPDLGVCLPRGCRRCRRIRLRLPDAIPLPPERNYAPDPEGDDLAVWLQAGRLGLLGVLDIAAFDGDTGAGDLVGTWRP